MAARLGLFFLLFLSIKCINADVKGVEESAISVSPEGKAMNDNLCTLCEEFASQALDYFHSNKTQEEIIERLHHGCSQLHHLKEQCILLVDYYAPLFFVEVGSVQPEAFCKKVDLCGAQMAVPATKGEDICSTCQRTILEVLTKLKDPETQLDIIQVLLKACNKVEQYKQQCKKLVFEYGPLILVNAEKFLETTDLCVAIRACRPAKAEVASQ
ncbi:saposin B domain-containing protein [Wolffia australiana]